MPICGVGSASLPSHTSAVDVVQGMSQRFTDVSACLPMPRPRVLLTLYFGAG